MPSFLPPVWRLALLLCMAWLLQATPARAQQPVHPQVEVFHWWVSGDEREEWDAVVPMGIQHLSKWQSQWGAAPFNTSTLAARHAFEQAGAPRAKKP